MAEKLIFPIGFDLEKAVKEAEKEGDKALKNLQQVFSRQPLVLKTDTRGFAELLQDTDTLKARLKEVKAQFDKMPTAVKFNLDSEGRVKQLSADGKALWDELMRINTALQGVSMSATQLLRQNQRELDAELKAEQKRQEAIAASLRTEYKRIEAKKQAEAASRRELEMLNRQYAAEERRQRLAASQASIAKRQQILNTLRAEENTIVNITAKLQHWQKVMNSSDMNGKQFKRATEEVQRLSQKLSDAQSKISRLTSINSMSAVKQTAAINQVNEALKNQDGYISRLLKRMAVYAGYSAISGFLTNVREVTAQFELQRVSLGAIIQDQQKANQLFAEIKSFALTSPLKILDLTKYTKQVAAYGIETKKLFSTTKMLADISVGLGVDMSRLTLFLGQVYATGYLRASELRQATEAGIPLVDKLAKKLSEANGKLVSAAEVMDLISKRAISFEQVEEVFKDMTSAGGEFYNMQVKQSQTLFGMWSKLGDAAALMYDQIGNTSSVNSAIKTTIGLLEKMMRNWQTTGTWIGALAVGMGTYAIALKNASIASKALTFSEGARLAITKAQVIATPKLVAAIIGQNAATKLSTVLTKAHTAAMLKQSVATNVLSRAFWGLSAAMLANPWAIALAAVVAAGYAIYQFTTRVETAADRTEKLNNAVASLKNLDDTVKPLIDTYNELIDKTERTAEEEKKLSEVTHELAKRYPGAVTALGEFGGQVELVSEKLNELYKAERKQREELAKSDLEKVKADYDDLIKKREYYSKQIAEGGRYVTVSREGALDTEYVKYNQEQIRGFIKSAEELDKQIGELGTTITNTERALGLLPSIEEEAIEKFGSWRKELQSFRTELASGAKIQLFDNSTITQFKSLDEAMQESAKKYKDNTELVERYTKALSDMTASASSRADAEEALAKAQEEQNLALAALTRFGYKPSDFDKSSGRGAQSDPRLSILQEMVSTLKQVNKEYDELAKKEGATKALADTQRVYADTFKNMQQLAAKYKFDLPDFGVPTDAASLTKYLEAVKDAMAKLPKSDKAVLALQVDIEKLKTDELQKKIEQKLKDLSDKISRTKTAKEFYDKILSQTGDIELAGNLTMSIYGSEDGNIQELLAQQIQEYFGEYEVEIPVIAGTDKIDYKRVRELAKAAYDAKKIGKDAYDALDKIATDGEKDLAKIAEQGTKLLLKFDEIAQQRVNIEQEAGEKIRQLREAEAIFLASNASEQEKAAYKKRTDKAVAGVEADRDLGLLKLKDEYLRFFSAIHSLTNKEAETLRTQVRQALFKAFQSGAISADQLKKELKAVDEQFRKLKDDSGMAMDYLKGGFDGLIQRVRDTADELQSVAAEISKMESPDQISEGQKSFIDKILGKFGNESTGKSFADLFSKANGDTAQMAGNLQNCAEGMEGMAGGAASALAMVDRIITDVARTIEGVAAIRDQLNEMRSEDNQLGGVFWDAFEYLENFNKYAAKGWEDLKSGNIVGAVQNTVQSIISIFGTAQAQKVRRLDKEIKKQAELLERLEYTYSRLEKTAEKVFSTEYIANYNQQLKILNAQAEAYRKQAEAEKSKGKKADKEKLKDYENSVRDTMNEIEDMQSQLIERFTGTSRHDVAKQMAQSWLDAKASMSDTFAAIKSDYKDMIKNMIVEGAAARLIEQALAPMWDSVDKMLKNNNVQGAVDALIGGMDSALNSANNSMEVLWNALEARGYDMKQLIGDVDTNLTGIKRDIASASEEQITGLAATMNTWSYYVSFVPGISTDVAAIRQVLENGVSAPIAASASGEWTDWQQQAMDQYMAIQRNTADTVVECRRIALACSEEVSLLKRVITNNPSTTAYGIKVFT